MGLSRPGSTIECLLDDLCVRLGFCLPPSEHADLVEAPPPSVESFTDAVFRAEGLDPDANKQLRRQVTEMVSAAFARMESTA
jgi:hypothetical protein